ncbi:MAG: hydantoinase/oxoprolinase family protein, partial [Steroidobacteraceae bacterium]|nr:hydantoinase/oxoprolinase family protein [Steroidobacteraceae bacterium]
TAGMHVAGPLGIENIITVDMGGTSFDITLTKDGKTNLSKNIDFLRYRIGTPMIQVETLGAGGGSIAWIDAMGLLNVGPQSAGANPGPVCYMRGGELPTVTDANVVLGYLNPSYLLGGRVKIDGAAARRAIEEKIAKPLGISVEHAARGIFDIVNNNMVNGIRRVSVERGYDPRDFVLVGAGGATALHIASLAREIGVKKVLVPKLASGLCAFGQILSNVKYTKMSACPMRVGPHADWERIDQRFHDLEREAIGALQAEGFETKDIRVERSIDMRYLGQVHECTVDIATMSVNAESFKEIRRRFDQRHQELFTYCEPDGVVEIVNIETTVSGVVPPLKTASVASQGASAAAPVKEHRNMVFGHGAAIRSVLAPVYDGEGIEPGMQLTGPGVIEEITTSIVIEPGWVASLDASGVYVLEDKQVAAVSSGLASVEEAVAA